MDQFERGDMVVRQATGGKQTTIEMYEHYHKYHGCLGMVIQAKAHKVGTMNIDKMYQVRWFKPNGDGDFDDHWYQDYQIGHLDGRHKWK